MNKTEELYILLIKYNSIKKVDAIKSMINIYLVPIERRINTVKHQI